MAGRKPIPIKLINTKYTKTKGEKQQREKAEPKVKKINTSPPKHLSEEAKKEWRTLVKFYKNLDMEIVCNLDRNIMELYCESMVSYRNAMQAIRNAGEVIIDLRGKPIQNPWVFIAQKASVEIKNYGQMLLLDPLSRAKIGVADTKSKKDKEEDPMSELLKINPRNF